MINIIFYLQLPFLLSSNTIFITQILLGYSSKGAMWFWRAMDDYHGTTVNLVALKYRDVRNWSNLAKFNPSIAQWTMVSVITAALVYAAGKSEVNSI